MAGRGHVENLTPWKPGQPGNPKGSSRKARAKAYLRDVLPEGLAEELTAEERESLGAVGEGVVLGDIAKRRLKQAILSGSHTELMDVLRLHASIEPKQYEVDHSGGVEVASESRWAEFSGAFDRIKSCETAIVSVNGVEPGKPPNGAGNPR